MSGQHAGSANWSSLVLQARRRPRSRQWTSLLERLELVVQLRYTAGERTPFLGAVDNIALEPRVELIEVARDLGLLLQLRLSRELALLERLQNRRQLAVVLPTAEPPVALAA